MRAGAAKPESSTVEAFKQALLRAKGINSEHRRVEIGIIDTSIHYGEETQ